LLELQQIHELPADVLDIEPDQLHKLIPRPTLLHLPGRQHQPLFVSILLHGNEITGLLALQQVLRKYQGRELPRALSVFFGNTDAVRAGVRRLPDQPDYNRSWPGTIAPASAETQLMKTVWDEMRSRQPFASVDLHNNTGLNPHYACVNVLQSEFLQLASLFGRTVVFFQTPKGTQSAAMARLCPAVTLECGKPGEAHGVEHAAEFVDACLHLTEIPRHPVAEADLHLFHTVAQVRIPADLTFTFGDEPADLNLMPDLERMNFREMPAGTVLGTLNEKATPRLIAVNDEGANVEQDYFTYEAGELRLRRNVMPSMLTLDSAVIRQDCLCYLMERMDLRRTRLDR